MSSEKRFKHKLNMLEPGTRMIECIGILILVGLIFYIFRLKTVAFCIWVAAGIVFAVLLVLLTIEAHQDKVMNDIAIKENQKKDESLTKLKL